MLVVAAALVAGESIFVTFTCLSCDGLDLTVWLCCWYELKAIDKEVRILGSIWDTIRLCLPSALLKILHQRWKKKRCRVVKRDRKRKGESLKMFIVSTVNIFNTECCKRPLKEALVQRAPDFFSSVEGQGRWWSNTSKGHGNWSTQDRGEGKGRRGSEGRERKRGLWHRHVLWTTHGLKILVGQNMRAMKLEGGGGANTVQTL